MENTNKIKVQIEVTDYSESYFLLNGACTMHLIPKAECIVVPSVEETELEVKGLPKKWCVQHFEESLDWIQRNAEIGGKHIRKSGYYMFPNNDFKSNFSDHFPEGYTEINQEQFFAHVWDKTKDPEPKLIAKAGSYVKLSDKGDFEGNLERFNKPILLTKDLYEGHELDNGNICNTHLFNMVFEPCPAPRTPIGVYEGVEIFDGDIGYLITYSDMKINTYVFRDVSFKTKGIGESQFSSKVYLTPEAVNARLKEEVKKKAKERKFTIEEVEYWFFTPGEAHNFIDYAIELIEKEYQVKYLNH